MRFVQPFKRAYVVNNHSRSMTLADSQFARERRRTDMPGASSTRTGSAAPSASTPNESDKRTQRRRRAAAASDATMLQRTTEPKTRLQRRADAARDSTGSQRTPVETDDTRGGALDRHCRSTRRARRTQSIAIIVDVATTIDEGANRPRHVSGACGRSACRWCRRSRTSSTTHRRSTMSRATFGT